MIPGNVKKGDKIWYNTSYAGEPKFYRTRNEALSDIENYMKKFIKEKGAESNWEDCLIKPIFLVQSCIVGIFDFGSKSFETCYDDEVEILSLTLKQTSRDVINKQKKFYQSFYNLQKNDYNLLLDVLYSNC